MAASAGRGFGTQAAINTKAEVMDLTEAMEDLLHERGNAAHQPTGVLTEKASQLTDRFRLNQEGLRPPTKGLGLGRTFNGRKDGWFPVKIGARRCNVRHPS